MGEPAGVPPAERAKTLAEARRILVVVECDEEAIDTRTFRLAQGLVDSADEHARLAPLLRVLLEQWAHGTVDQAELFAAVNAYVAADLAGQEGT